eukprot:31021-Pelagococcus_subviridis.AAC.2
MSRVFPALNNATSSGIPHTMSRHIASTAASPPPSPPPSPSPTGGNSASTTSRHPLSSPAATARSAP